LKTKNDIIWLSQENQEKGGRSECFKVNPKKKKNRVTK